MFKNEIIFCLPPSRWREKRYSLGVMYLSSYLTSKGIENDILDSKSLAKNDNNLQIIEKNILEIIKRESPKYIGFTMSVNEIQEVLNLAAKIKQNNPNIILIGGGPGPSIYIEEILRNGFDYIIRGEGEEVLFNLIRELNSQKRPNIKTKGVSYLETNSVIHNSPAELISDINILPMPAYDKVDMKKYLTISSSCIRLFLFRAAIVTTSRGCPYNCCYCNCNYVYGRKMRFRNKENIQKEISVLKNKYGVEAIWFGDDTLTVNYEHLKMVCEIMKENKLMWGCQSRVDLIDEKTVKLLKNSNCIQIDFGVESGNERILQTIIHKKITKEQIKFAYQLCEKYGLRTLTNLMIGLPTETLAEMKDTMDLAKELISDRYVLTIATPLPETELWDKAKPDISLADWGDVHFFSNEMVHKYNRSAVENITVLFEQYRRELNRLEKINFLKHWKINLLIFLRSKYKYEKILYQLKKITLFIIRKMTKASQQNG